LARTSHSRSERAKARKGTAETAGEADGQKAGSVGSLPASIDVALDAFIVKAHRDFNDATAQSPSTGSRGTYHPAPANSPVRWLGIGLLLGLTLGVLLSLFFSLAISR